MHIHSSSIAICSLVKEFCQDTGAFCALHADTYAHMIKNLRHLLRENGPLPGLAAQRIMAPIGRFPVGYDSSPPGAKHAAVLICLHMTPRGGEERTPTTFPLIQRMTHARDKHSGQIALPGGKMHEGESVEQAALREAHEEIGLAPDSVDVLGTLTPLYIPHSNFSVTPVLGVRIGDTHGMWTPQPEEVEQVIDVDVDELQVQV